MMRRYLRPWSSIVLLLFSLLVVVSRVEATDGMRGFDACVVERDEVILEDFYFACRTLEIKGFIDGDVIGMASEVTIAREAQVTGDIWVIGGQLTIEGVVGDDLHFFGADLDVTGLARFPNRRSDIISAGISIEISKGTVIPGDIIHYGYQTIIKGKVNGDIDFQGQALVIQNDVAGEVSAIVGDQEASAPLSRLPFVYSVNFRDPGLYFSDGDEDQEGYINGNLHYEAPRRVNIGDRVGGEVDYRQSVQNTNIASAEESDTLLQIIGNYILVTIRDVASIGLVGILTLNFFSTFITEPSYRIQKHPVSAFGLGLLLSLLSIPAAFTIILTSLLILLVVFIITLSELTLMVSLILLVLNLGFISGAFFLFAFLGRAITSFVIGYWVLRYTRRFWIRYAGTPPPVLSELWFSLLIGVMMLSLFVNLPLGAFVGTFQVTVSVIAGSTGYGAFFIYLGDLRSSNRRLSAVASPAKITPPPPPEDVDTDEDVPLGMNNLPPGFTGFND
jgi:hypothetical protein